MICFCLLFGNSYKTNLSMHKIKRKYLKFLIQNHLAAACQPGSRVMPKFSSCHPILQLGKKQKCWGTLLGFTINKFSLKSHKKVPRRHRSLLQTCSLQSDLTVSNFLPKSQFNLSSNCILISVHTPRFYCQSQFTGRQPQQLQLLLTNPSKWLY